MKQLIVPPLIVACLLLGASTSAQIAHADASPRAYAVIVGSNPGGAGQQALQFAERDARSVAAVLQSIGGYKREDIALLTRPTPGQLLGALDRVGRKLKRDAAGGTQSIVLFYYSGHARANALNLGSRELSLTTLRERIMRLPATLRIVILDACQSGAFSKVKGVSPAADFSFNSVRRLNAAGVAVMASSAATELSQESSKLGGSYFTHHLLVALRGAGDKNHDGRVSLHEAYTYAYHHTLIATAKTAVGRQHVTLETDLKGKGDVALTYPARATATLVLPRSLKAELLIYRRSSKTVIAEVHKSVGTLRLALPPTSYRVIVRQGKRARECDVDLTRGGAHTMHTAGCRVVVLRSDTSKGAFVVARPWAMELGAGWGAYRTDAFTDTLTTFGYEKADSLPGHWDVTVTYRFHRYMAAVGTINLLESNQYNRRTDTEVQRFSWNSRGLSGGIRGIYPMGDYYDVFTPFAELRVGMAYTQTKLDVGVGDPVIEHHFGYQVAVSVGADLMIWRSLGLTFKMTAVTAPSISNRLDDTHDTGGIYGLLGMRLAF